MSDLEIEEWELLNPDYDPEHLLELERYGLIVEDLEGDDSRRDELSI